MEAGLFSRRNVKGRIYPDFFSSKAFGLGDHQVAHILTSEDQHTQQAKNVLQDLKGIHKIIDKDQQTSYNLNHKNTGDLILVAEEGSWFAYPWWTKKREAPDFACHIDIHNKPGFDPCELFWGFPPRVSLDINKVKGSHGRIGKGNEVAWATSCQFTNQPTNLTELADAVKEWLKD